MTMFLLGIVILLVSFFLTGGNSTSRENDAKEQDTNTDSNKYTDNNTSADISGVPENDGGGTDTFVTIDGQTFEVKEPILQGVYLSATLPSDLSKFWSLKIGRYVAVAPKGQYADYFTFSQWAYGELFAALPASFFDDVDISVFGLFRTAPSCPASSDMESLVAGVVNGKNKKVSEYVILAKRRLEALLSGSSVWDNTTKNPVVLPRRWCKGMTLDKMYYVPLYGFKACLQFKLVRRETDNAFIWSYRGFKAQFSTNKAANDLNEKSVDWLGVPPKHPSFIIQVNETEK